LQDIDLNYGSATFHVRLDVEELKNLMDRMMALEVTVVGQLRKMAEDHDALTRSVISRAVADDLAYVKIKGLGDKIALLEQSVKDLSMMNGDAIVRIADLEKEDEEQNKVNESVVKAMTTTADKVKDLYKKWEHQKESDSLFKGMVLSLLGSLGDLQKQINDLKKSY
jgi:chromosome segregation ATPase